MRNKKNVKNTIILTIILILLLFPIVILINSSLKTYNELITWPPKFFNSFHFENYTQVLSGDKSIVKEFFNSLQISVITMLICILIGSLAAYSVTRFDFKGKNAFMNIILVTQMFSSVIIVNAMYIIFRQFNLLDTKLSLIIATTTSCLPMTVWLLHSYFSQIPIDYEEASWMDGANRLQGIKDVLLPLCFPGIITAGLFAFIAAWGDLIYAKSFITSPELRTISLALTDFQDLYKTTWETQMAASVVATLPPFILFFLIQKYLIKSMVSQGVKG